MKYNEFIQEKIYQNTMLKEMPELKEKFSARLIIKMISGKLIDKYKLMQMGNTEVITTKG